MCPSLALKTDNPRPTFMDCITSDTLPGSLSISYFNRTLGLFAINLVLALNFFSCKVLNTKLFHV